MDGGCANRTGLVLYYAWNWRLADGISGLCVREELDPTTALTDERVKVEETFSELCPVPEEEMCSTAGSSDPEWNVTHVRHGRVAAWTIYGKTCLSSRL